MKKSFGLALLLFLLLIPFVLPVYTLHVFIVGLYYAVLASSWSLLAGYGGKLSFAHSAFSAIGAYSSSLLVLKTGVSPFIGLPFGALMGGVFGLLIGVLCLRMSGPYLALTTIAFSEILRIFVMAEYKFTEGSIGIHAPPFFSGTSKLPYYYLALSILLFSLFTLLYVVRSRYGLLLRALREDEDGAAAMAVNVVRYRIIAFVISSFFAGLAGAFYAHFILLVSPQMMILSDMALILGMSIVGGIESLIGSALGALFLEFLSEYLRALGEWRMVFLGLILLLTLKFFPSGLFEPCSQCLKTATRLLRIYFKGKG
jgi:branched-chain amino acid transport system permease protein